MAGQTFDFELRADDQVSGALKKIGDQVKGLQPELTETEKGLKLGGQETQDELSDVNAAFKTLGRFAKDNVQFIGDMVPPLRNFLGNAGKIGGMAGKFGLAGGAAYIAGKGIAALGGGMADAAHDAYSLQIAAENAGMSVKDFSQLSGAMRLLGSDSESAQGSVEGLYKTFNDALQGRNSAALAIMNQINAPIVRNDDGTANVLKTVEQLAKVMPKLSPQNQKTVADALGLDANGLQLLREGARLKELLAKSDQVGLTVDPKINADLVTLNRNLTEVGSSWDGLKNRVKQKLAGSLLSDGSVGDGLKGVAHVMQTPTDPVAWNEALGNLRGNEGDWMRRARSDKKYFDTLQPDDQLNLLTGQMNDGLRNKLRVQYGLSDQASLLAGDAQAITRQPNSVANSPPVSGKVDPTAASVRNNNPWNLNYVGQAGAVPAGRFARFASPEAGVQAADRQLQLYATGKSKNVDHPLSTLNEIIHKASPRSDGNDPEAMIKRAASQLGVRPDESLNLMDTGMRSRVLSALFNQEGNNPFDAARIEQIISGKNSAGPQAPAPAPLLPVQPPAIQPEPSANDRTSPAVPPAPLLAVQPPATQPEPSANDRTSPAVPPAPLLAVQPPATQPEPSANDRTSPAVPPAPSQAVQPPAEQPQPSASALTASASPPVPSLASPPAPSLVTPAAAPSLVAPAPERNSGSAQDVARAVSEALKENGMKLEVTFINPANGQRQTMTATGGKVTTAMPFPG